MNRIKSTHLTVIFLILGFLSACHTEKVVHSSAFINYQITSKYDSLSDTSLQNSIAPYRDSLKKTMKRVVAVSARELTARRPESPLSNLISDLTVEEAQAYCDKKQNKIKVNIGLVNMGGLRAPILAGPITVEEIYEVMPFENALVLVQINGERLHQLLDIIASRGGEGVSGVSFKITGSHATDIRVNEQPISTEQKYWIATSDYIALGGDGMTPLKNAEQTINTKILIRDLILSHFEILNSHGEKVDAKKDGRISYGK